MDASDRYQIINPLGQAVNTILWDGESELDLPTGYYIRPDDGKKYVADNYVPPPLETEGE